MSAINDGGPAFPRDTKWNLDGSVSQSGSKGMSLRDWFAGMALSGILNNSNAFANMGDKDVAENCYRAADAMLAARERKEDT